MEKVASASERKNYAVEPVVRAIRSGHTSLMEVVQASGCSRSSVIRALHKLAGEGRIVCTTEPVRGHARYHVAERTSERSCLDCEHRNRWEGCVTDKTAYSVCDQWTQVRQAPAPTPSPTVVEKQTPEYSCTGCAEREECNGSACEDGAEPTPELVEACEELAKELVAPPPATTDELVADAEQVGRALYQAACQTQTPAPRRPIDDMCRVVHVDHAVICEDGTHRTVIGEDGTCLIGDGLVEHAEPVDELDAYEARVKDIEAWSAKVGLEGTFDILTGVKDHIEEMRQARRDYAEADRDVRVGLAMLEAGRAELEPRSDLEEAMARR